MRRYRMEKTTMGHKYRIRMDGGEIAERVLYRIALVTLPFIGAAGMFFIWVKMG